MKEKEPFHPIPGLSREAEEKQLAGIISIAQDSLTRTVNSIRQLSDDLYEIYDQMEVEESEAKQSHAESYYVGRVGISRDGLEPVVIDWRAPIASVYYENVLGSCQYTVKNEGTYEIDLQRKRTYEIAEDRLKDFFDSDVIATDELLNKYLAKSKKAVLEEIIATIQKEQNAIIRVQFRKGKTMEFEPGYWNYEPNSPISWTARAGKSQVAVDTGKIAVRIDKKTGAMRFFDKNGKRLLAEKTTLPRQIEENAVPQKWVHFDLPDHEKIFAKGILKKELVQMNHKARYISLAFTFCVPRYRNRRNPISSPHKT